jgi:hypothetical protein
LAAAKESNPPGYHPLAPDENGRRKDTRTQSIGRTPTWLTERRHHVRICPKESTIRTGIAAIEGPANLRAVVVNLALLGNDIEKRTNPIAILEHRATVASPSLRL